MLKEGNNNITMSCAWLRETEKTLIKQNNAKIDLRLFFFVSERNFSQVLEQQWNGLAFHKVITLNY